MRSAGMWSSGAGLAVLSVFAGTAAATFTGAGFAATGADFAALAVLTATGPAFGSTGTACMTMLTPLWVICVGAAAAAVVTGGIGLLTTGLGTRLVAGLCAWLTTTGLTTLIVVGCTGGTA